MPYQHVLAAYDGSQSSCDAVKAAIDLAGASSRITVVSVVPFIDESLTFGGLGDELSEKTTAMYDAEVFRQLHEETVESEKASIRDNLEQNVGPLGDTVTVDIAFGSNPASGIINYAQDAGCDVIVMGCRGLGALRGMLGSVSYGVLRSAPVPVLVVK